MLLGNMKLREDSKGEIRGLIEKELGLVPNTVKVKLDKELLEELLFLKINLGHGKCVKLPIWSGDFLEKLDLSSVSFEDVSYAILYDIYTGKVEPDIYSFVKDKITVRRYMVYYGNTNAKIDFKDSYEYKLYGKIFIHGFNFTGTDLSNNKIDNVFDIERCHFEKTGLEFVSINNKSSARSSNFTGIDLSFYETSADTFLGNKDVFDKQCCVRNTGLKISGLSKRTANLDDFLNYFNDGRFDGCYLNNVLVKSCVEREETRRQIILQYEDKVRILKQKVEECIKPYKAIK